MLLSLKVAMITREKKSSTAMFVVRNDKGLHTRPSTELVRRAATFRSDIHLVYKKQEVNAKSLLGILMLAAPRGAKIRVVAEGADAKDAVEAIVDLADQSFHIQY